MHFSSLGVQDEFWVYHSITKRWPSEQNRNQSVCGGWGVVVPRDSQCFAV